MGQRFDLAHLGQRARIKRCLAFGRGRKVEKRHFRVFFPVGLNDLGQGIDPGVGHFDHGNRGVAFGLKAADLGAHAGQGVKDGGFSRTGKSN